jgi:DNA-binding winged helix-turn-helix (wHTH) protein/tetratricopeptide (TPR) repeat protein
MATMSSQIKRLYEFGPFRLDPQKRLLMRGSEPVSLTPKAIETLIVLVENRDRVVSKDHLMKTLWPDSFVEESNLSQNIFVLRKALGDSTQEKRYILTVPGQGYQFTETVRELGEKEHEEVLVVQTHSQSELVLEHHASSLRWLWVGLAVVVVAGGMGLLISRARHKAGSEDADRGSEPVSNIKVRRSVAVLSFRNLSHRPEREWLSTALAEMLSTELATGDQLRIVSGDQVTRATGDQSLGETDTLTRNSVAGLHASLGTDYLALGSYVVVGEGPTSAIRLDFRLQNAATGDVVAEDAVSGSESDLSDLIFEAGSRMRERLAVNKTSSEQEAQVRASMPSNPKAVRLYAEGLTKLREFEAKAAIDLFSQAATIEPESAQVHAALGSAWQTLGYEAKAAAEATTAGTLSANLRSEDRLAIEGQSLQFSHDWPKAIQIYRTLSDLYPDNLDYGLRLANVQKLSGVGKESVATLEACRKLPSLIGSDPRIDVAESEVLITLGDFKQAQQIAAAGAEKARLQHARLILAEARHQESYALERLGELDRALAGLSEAKLLYAAAGDLGNSAHALYHTGVATYDKGDFEGSRRQVEEALLVFRKIGNAARSANALEMIGNTLYEEGKLTEARSKYEEALRIDREIGSSDGRLCSELGNIANILDGLGDLAGAEKMHRQVLQMFDKAGNKRGSSSTEINLGIVLEEQGDLAGAEREFLHSLQLSREIGHKVDQGFDLYGLADVLYHHDDLKTAREKAEQALALRKELGENSRSAESMTQLSLLSLEQGQLADAEKLASESVHELENAHAPETSASAYAVLAETLLAEGRLAAAQSAAQQATAFAAKAGNRPAQFDAALATSRVNVAGGKYAEARKSLSPVQTQAAKFGYAIYLFEARLILGEIDIKSGHTAAGRSQLSALEKDARAKGFLRIARKAAAA